MQWRLASIKGVCDERAGHAPAGPTIRPGGGHVDDRMRTHLEPDHGLEACPELDRGRAGVAGADSVTAL